MSHHHHEEETKEKKERDWSSLIFVPIVLAMVLGPLVGLWEECGNRVYGSRPQDLVDVPLVDMTPKKLGHALRSTSVRDTTVKTLLLASAGHPYKSATFTWTKDEPGAPHEIEFDSEEHEGDPGQDVVDVLQRRFHSMNKGDFTWGTFQIHVSIKHGDANIQIGGTRRTNPLFDRQLEAGRQVLLNALFGTAITVSDREIADVLGSGYAIGDLAKFDPQTRIENAGVLRAIAPGLTSPRNDIYDIPLDHPLFASLRLSYENRANGALTSMQLETTKAFEASRPLLKTCLTTKLGSPGRDKVTDYAASTTQTTFTFGSIYLTLRTKGVSISDGPYDPTSFGLFVTTLNACRDAHETGSTKGNEKK